MTRSLHHVLEDFVHGSYYRGRSIAVTLVYNATVVISHGCEECEVLFRIFFDSNVVVPICSVKLAPIFSSSD